MLHARDRPLLPFCITGLLAEITGLGYLLRVYMEILCPVKVGGQSALPMQILTKLAPRFIVVGGLDFQSSQTTLFGAGLIRASSMKVLSNDP